MNAYERSNSPCFETMRIAQGEIKLLEYHQERVNRTVKELFKSDQDISIPCPKVPDNRSYRYKFIYNPIGSSQSISPLQKSPCQRVYLLEEKSLRYRYKYLNRAMLTLGNHYAIAENSEILFTRHGLLSDTRIHNVLLKKNGEYFTPARPLLHGVQRAYLIDNKRIAPVEISLDSLAEYEEIRLINALNPFEHAPVISMDQVYLIDPKNGDISALR